MDAIEAIRGRRSVRNFSGRRISEDDLATIIDCARLAPTARNEQPWIFVAVDDGRMLKSLGSLADHGRFIADAPLCICVFCRDTKYYLEDGSAATQNIMLAAYALGIGTCWVAGDKKPYADAVARLLGVPQEFRLVSLVAAGYPAAGKTAGASQKKELRDVLRRNRF